MSYTKGDQDELTDFEEACAAKLRARASVLAAELPVLTQWGGSLEQQYQAEENKNFCVLLYPISGPFSGQNLRQLRWDNFDLQFRVIVNPELQDAGAKNARWWALEILKEFHGGALPDADYDGLRFFGSNRENPAPVDHPKLNIFDVFLRTSLGLTQA